MVHFITQASYIKLRSFYSRKILLKSKNLFTILLPTSSGFDRGQMWPRIETGKVEEIPSQFFFYPVVFTLVEIVSHGQEPVVSSELKCSGRLDLVEEKLVVVGKGKESMQDIGGGTRWEAVGLKRGEENGGNPKG